MPSDRNILRKMSRQIPSSIPSNDEEVVVNWDPFALHRDRVEVIFVLRMLLFSVFKFGSSPHLLLLISCGSSGECPSSTLILGVFVLGRSLLSSDQTFQDLLTFKDFTNAASHVVMRSIPSERKEAMKEYMTKVRRS